jgi:hypothetical protein
VAEKQVSCQRLGSNPLVNDQNAGPEEKIPFSTCRLGDFARGSEVFYKHFTKQEAKQKRPSKKIMEAPLRGGTNRSSP